MNRCVKCILPDNYPGISFDENGKCNFCQNFEDSPEPDWDEKYIELKKIVDEIKRQNLKYDVIVPWSGGKDSTYVLYYMKKVLGLKVLAVNYNNGFQSNFAIKNLHSISETMGINLVTLKPDFTLLRRLYAAYLRNSGEFCTVCNTVGYIIILSFALKESIAMNGNILVAGGWSNSLEGQREIHTFDYGSFQEIISQEKGLLEEFESSILVNKNVCNKLRVIGDPRVNSGKAVSQVKLIQLPDYIPWNPIHIADTLTNEVGFDVEDNKNNAHLDCIAHPLKAYFSTRKYGFAQDTITYSSMIRLNQINRDEALGLVNHKHLEEPADMDLILKILNVKRDEINFDAKWHTGNNI